MTLFTVYYNDTHWKLSPLNAKNNVQGVGNVAFNEVLTLKEAALTAVQEAFVRKIVTELKDFDNLYYEVCNEPYIRNEASLEWQWRMTDVIVDAESKFPARHLISWNIANHKGEVKDPHPAVSIFNFHYARPPVAVDTNYGLNKVIGMNETGFDGTTDATYRTQGWDFLFAGGALYNNLDYSFAVGHEDGSFGVPGSDPGWGSGKLRSQLGILRTLMESMPLTRMAPAPSFVEAGVPEGASARALAAPGDTYAVYLHHGKVLSGYQPSYAVGTRKQSAKLRVNLPAKKYVVEWWNPREGMMKATMAFDHAGGSRELQTPAYSEDLAIRIRAGS
jgi:hypothetical protein